MGDKNTIHAVFMKDFYISLKMRQESKRLSTFPLSLARVCGGRKVCRDHEKWENAAISSLIRFNKFSIVRILTNLFKYKVYRYFNDVYPEKTDKKIDRYFNESINKSLLYAIGTDFRKFEEINFKKLKFGLKILESEEASLAIKSLVTDRYGDGNQYVPKAYKFSYFFYNARKRLKIEKLKKNQKITDSRQINLFI